MKTILLASLLLLGGCDKAASIDQSIEFEAYCVTGVAWCKQGDISWNRATYCYADGKRWKARELAAGESFMCRIEDMPK